MTHLTCPGMQNDKAQSLMASTHGAGSNRVQRQDQGEIQLSAVLDKILPYLTIKVFEEMGREARSLMAQQEHAS